MVFDTINGKIAQVAMVTSATSMLIGVGFGVLIHRSLTKNKKPINVHIHLPDSVVTVEADSFVETDAQKNEQNDESVNDSNDETS